MTHFVKDRSGRTRAVADNYILQDGESLAVAMMATDAAPPSHLESSSDLWKRLVSDRLASETAPVAVTGRNGPPVIVKDTAEERSADFAAGAAFASQALYERRISDGWRDRDTASIDRNSISDRAEIDPVTGHGRLVK